MSLDELRLHRWNLIHAKADRSVLDRVNRELLARTGEEIYITRKNGD
jgi:hypothetical protein